MSKYAFAFALGLILIPILRWIPSQYLDKLANLATFLGVALIAFAYFDYNRKKKNESVFSVTDQLHFFRTIVISASNDVYLEIKRKDSNYVLVVLELKRGLKILAMRGYT